MPTPSNRYIVLDGPGYRMRATADQWAKIKAAGDEAFASDQPGYAAVRDEFKAQFCVNAVVSPLRSGSTPKPGGD